MSVYESDINNDGKRELIGTEINGSGGYLSLQIFPDTQIPWPEGMRQRDGGWFSHDFYDPGKKTSQLLIEICGKNYMTLAGARPGTIEGYIWKDGKNRRACDPEWTNYQLTLFEHQFTSKQFTEASDNLEAFIQGCEAELPTDKHLEILSLLAKTATKLNDRDDCLKWIAQAKKLPGYDLNQEVSCSSEPSPQSDFAWLLKHDPKNQVVLDPKFDALLAATAPSLQYKAAQIDPRAKAWIQAGWTGARNHPDHVAWNLREQLKKNIWGPGDFKIVDSRFVTITGFKPHDASSVALIWVDLRENNTLFALSDSSGETCMTVGSRTVDPRKAPPEFWSAIQNWTQRDSKKMKCRIFVDAKSSSPQIGMMD